MTQLKKSMNRDRQTQHIGLVVASYVGFWLLAIVLIGGLLWVPFVQLYYRSNLQMSGILTAVVGLSLANSLRPRRRLNNRLHGTVLSRQSASLLYKLVEHNAHKFGLDVPVTIYLLSDANAAIACQRNYLGKPVRLEVCIGLPLFATLSEAELGAIIVHELGHFIGGNSALTQWLYRVRFRIAQIVNDLDNSLFFGDWIFTCYGRWFLAFSSPTARAQEFAADALAAKRFGPAAVRAALEKTHLIRAMWSTYLDYELFPAIRRGARLPIFDGFRRFCKPGVKRAAVQQAITRLEVQVATELDVHPTLAERVAAIVPNAKPGYPPLSQCTHLLGGEVETEDAWYEAFDPDSLIVSDWDDYGKQIVQGQIQYRFVDSWLDPTQAKFTNLVQMATRPDDLWDKLKPEGVSFLSPQGKRNHILEVIEEWIAACLIQRGYTVKVRPGQALVLQRGEQDVLPSLLLQAALSGSLRSAHLAQYESAAEQVAPQS